MTLIWRVKHYLEQTNMDEGLPVFAIKVGCNDTGAFPLIENTLPNEYKCVSQHSIKIL